MLPGPMRNSALGGRPGLAFIIFDHENDALRTSPRPVSRELLVTVGHVKSIDRDVAIIVQWIEVFRDRMAPGIADALGVFDPDLHVAHPSKKCPVRNSKSVSAASVVPTGRRDQHRKLLNRVGDCPRARQNCNNPAPRALNRWGVIAHPGLRSDPEPRNKAVCRYENAAHLLARRVKAALFELPAPYPGGVLNERA